MADRTVSASARKRLDGDILLTVHVPGSTESFLLAAQTLEGAAMTAAGMRQSGFVVTTRVWNGKAYSEERI